MLWFKKRFGYHGLYRDKHDYGIVAGFLGTPQELEHFPPFPSLWVALTCYKVFLHHCFCYSYLNKVAVTGIHWWELIILFTSYSAKSHCSLVCNRPYSWLDNLKSLGLRKMYGLICSLFWMANMVDKGITVHEVFCPCFSVLSLSDFKEEENISASQ